MEFTLKVFNIAKEEEPNLIDESFEGDIRDMLVEAIGCEMSFAEDALQLGVGGLSKKDMKQYLEYVADLRLKSVGFKPMYNAQNPFGFMIFQDVMEHTNFFERRVSSYQANVTGEVSFDEQF